MSTDKEPVIIVGAGLAGLVAAYELTERGIKTVLLDQENSNNLGGQAFWSLGGLFLVNSSDQRRNGIHDSRQLAMQDWMGTAAFDRQDEDTWPRRWAEAFVNFASQDFENYVKNLGLTFLNVGWAERGNGKADGHGNSVPRFHLTWGLGPEIVRVFSEPLNKAAKKGLVEFKFRHAVDKLLIDDKSGRAIGVSGRILADDDSPRGVKSNREEKEKFELRGAAVLVASGGIGGNIDAVRAKWPTDRLGKVPEHMVAGVPAHVDGRMIGITETAGGRIINADRMWHYTEGLQNWKPIWPKHGIRILPGPSSLWLDATGKRLPPFLFPGSDTLATLKYICSTGYDYTWFILDQSIIAREFALSGSEQNPDIADKSMWKVIMQRILSSKGTQPVQNFQKYGADFVVRDNLHELVVGMNKLAAERNGPALDYDKVKAIIDIRDSQMANSYSKDAQAMLLHNARSYWPEKLSRLSKPHQLLNKTMSNGPLIAVRLNILTRKSLGGIETNLSSNVMRSSGEAFPGLYAAGEVAGFGGGGVHGYSALEGTFLGGCIFSGRTAGRAIAQELQGSNA
ncbi:hypothetical protein CDD82_5983 [Ophiocordyceps australis]|uniref:FAD-dependent oxidoreductase 2 FAD-binding domain-containing protein n=1 Tax=Ophiocordyceps australis TaxID=1399860 RepID=A0A2C5YUG1_9HYPO|nr:hypothetical protein CDD82_5983 [Ophiocordyceps australis]